MDYQEKLFKSYMEDGEEIFMILHHHFIIILKPISIRMILHVIPSIIGWILFPQIPIIWALWLSIGLAQIFFQIIAYYFNALLVTNLNIVDVEWHGLFNRSAQRIEYNQIESFAFTVNGFLNTILNVGDISINKISGNVVEVESIFHPKKSIQILTKIQDDMVSGQNYKEHDNLKNILTNMLRNHIDEHGIVISEDDDEIEEY